MARRAARSSCRLAIAASIQVKQLSAPDHTQAEHATAGEDESGRVFSGFRWVLEVPAGQQFDEPLVLALKDTFATVAEPHARAMELPFLAVQFSLTAQMMTRLKGDLLRSYQLTFPVEPLGVPSGRLGYAHLAAWPALRAALARRGVVADGPLVAAAPGPSDSRSRLPRLRAHLYFEPSDVGVARPISWGDHPPPTAVELGRAGPTGVTMAGIDYARSQGRTIRAWWATLPDARQACEAGGRPPVSIVHLRQKRLPVGFVDLLLSAIREAAATTAGPQAMASLTSDLRITMVENGVFVRPGQQVATAVNTATYERFLQALARELSRRGVPVRADVELRDLGTAVLRQVLLEADAYFLSQDCELVFSGIVQAVWREHDADAIALSARRSEALAAAAASLSPSWTIDPASPLARLAPPQPGGGQVSVYVTGDARLPPDPGRQARAWVDALLNGGPRGAQRAIQEARTSRQIGALALARALAGTHLARRLPARLQTALEHFRLESGHRLHQPDLVGAGDQTAAGLAEILLASLREPALAEDLMVAARALLAGVQPPTLVVLGSTRAWLLPVPEQGSWWIGLVHDHLAAGYAEDLEALWVDDPAPLYPPALGERVLTMRLRGLEDDGDPAALEAFARWALDDARRRRSRGVRGPGAYVTLAEPRLVEVGLTRAFFLRETPAHVVVRCDLGDDQHRMALRLPRAGDAWDAWARAPGGPLLAAYLAGAYRDMVVPLDVAAFEEDRPVVPRAEGRVARPGSDDARLQPVGYIPLPRRRGEHGRGQPGEHHAPAAHGVSWYMRRLLAGHRASPNALEQAAQLGLSLPPEYTFVGAHVSPQTADPRSVPTALRTTVALSSLRAILQATRRPGR
jgi:hypothetical protein